VGGFCDQDPWGGMPPRAIALGVASKSWIWECPREKQGVASTQPPPRCYPRAKPISQKQPKSWLQHAKVPRKGGSNPPRRQVRAAGSPQRTEGFEGTQAAQYPQRWDAGGPSHAPRAQPSLLALRCPAASSERQHRARSEGPTA